MCASTELNGFYQNRTVQQTLCLPVSLGSGYWQRNSIHPRLEVMSCDIILKKDLFMSSKEQDHGTGYLKRIEKE